MKQFILSILIAFTTAGAWGTDYSKIDKQAANVPGQLKTAPEIAAHLTAKLKSPVDKTRAIYYWIAHNIRYDTQAMGKGPQTYTDPQQLVDEVLLRRKGVCGHFAELFNAMCHTVGIESYVVPGYTTNNGEPTGLSHAWNVVRINSRYYEIDATWAAGHFLDNSYKQEFDDQYFLVQPAGFIKSHIPFDPMLQFLDNPLTHKEIKAGDFSKLKARSHFNFADSIKASQAMGKADRLARENLRITNAGITNRLIREYVENNRNYIASARYNEAVDEFNSGVRAFNLYGSGKGRLFKDLPGNREKISDMLAASKQKMEKAGNLLKAIDPAANGLRSQVRQLQSNIREVEDAIRSEQAEVEKWILSGKGRR
ncbi:MAG TPA: transglutaminase domain-containing protein [Paludibacter sp.]|nr:transglutaminase domain-containing protein [Paludibacter sp.]